MSHLFYSPYFSETFFQKLLKPKNLVVLALFISSLSRLKLMLVRLVFLVVAIHGGEYTVPIECLRVFCPSTYRRVLIGLSREACRLNVSWPLGLEARSTKGSRQ